MTPERNMKSPVAEPDKSDAHFSALGDNDERNVRELSASFSQADERYQGAGYGTIKYQSECATERAKSQEALRALQLLRCEFGEAKDEYGRVYYWNAATHESTYTRPPDYNPPHLPSDL